MKHRDAIDPQAGTGPPRAAGDSPEPVPEPDALEQAAPVGDEEEDTEELIDELAPEVPEADALEQATPVPGQEEEAPGGGIGEP